ncbi:MAG: hypothetical protein BGN86_08165 [Caulobacterales bacterium 68-7]|nr:MAG: hypothetical protein BGN86_08165 [Caulobacterales bacterium 68-7]
MIVDPLKVAVAVALTGVLAYAGYTDWRHRRLPNWCSLAGLALFVPWAFSGPIDGVLLALAAFALAAVITFTMYAFKIIGAGDSKLFSVLALFAGIKLLPTFALVVAVSGGVVAMIYIALRPTENLIAFQSRGKVTYGRGVPYGLAIAPGALVIVWMQALGLTTLLKLPV